MLPSLFSFKNENHPSENSYKAERNGTEARKQTIERQEESEDIERQQLSEMQTGGKGERSGH